MKIISKALWICLLATFGQSYLQAQTIQGLSLETLKEQVTDTNGVYYYPMLSKRFAQNDVSLKGIDYIMLYYGYFTQSSYNPYKLLALEDSLAKLTAAKKGVEAIQLADKILEQNPTSLAAYIEKAYALHGTNQESLALVELNKYRALLSTVMASGVGNSYENPIIVMSPKDEEIVLLAHKLTSMSKSMNGQTGRYYHVYVVRNDKGKQYPLYFDITLPYTIGMKKLSEK
jgi:hypothetical protein